jgi:hypothetical protein
VKKGSQQLTGTALLRDKATYHGENKKNIKVVRFSRGSLVVLLALLNILAITLHSFGRDSVMLLPLRNLQRVICEIVATVIPRTLDQREQKKKLLVPYACK